MTFAKIRLALMFSAEHELPIELGSDEVITVLEKLDSLSAETGRAITRAEAAERDLAALREQTRWHKWPDERPAKEYVVEVMLDDGTIHDDLICFNGTWLSNDNVLFWREADFPHLPEPPEDA